MSLNDLGEMHSWTYCFTFVIISCWLRILKAPNDSEILILQAVYELLFCHCIFIKEKSMESERYIV